MIRKQIIARVPLRIPFAAEALHRTIPIIILWAGKAGKCRCIFSLRYCFEWLLTLKENMFKLVAGNKIFVNTNYTNSTFFFDQNGTFAGLNFIISSNSTLQFQYLKIFQWCSNTPVLEDRRPLNFIQQFTCKK